MCNSVRSKSGTHSPFLTGVGYMNDWPNILLPLNPVTRYSDYETGDQLESTYSGYHRDRPEHGTDNEEFWIFHFHDVRWDFLVARVESYNGYSYKNLIRNLFDILYCTPCDRFSVFMPGHDYNGVSKLQKPWSYGGKGNRCVCLVVHSC